MFHVKSTVWMFESFFSEILGKVADVLKNEQIQQHLQQQHLVFDASRCHSDVLTTPDFLQKPSVL